MNTITSDSGKHIIIVGGNGQMGRFFARVFESRGHAVASLDKDDPLTKESLSRAELVIIAVPMELAIEVTKTAAPLMQEDALLCDINSLKGSICKAMKEFCRCEALGLHPMFGPRTKDLKGQKIIVCPVNEGPLGKWFRHELQALGAVLNVSDPAEHDRMMGIIQVLTHFNTMVIAEALRRSGKSVAETLEYTSPIYKLELSVVGRLFAQSPDLYAEILMTNPRSEEMRNIFLEAAEQVNGIISRGSREEFLQHFEKSKEYFSDFAESALELSNRIIDDVVR